ncbi:hypothetical protein [Acidovorax sp. FJL06]|uniref:hypothetical protein n=1 Tax=Acidovorax sp. FJL06 TaxID=2153365 RepID=UPI000F567BEF|nr:hypothetical protein [Acidovorax sp. FJL06]
MALDHGILNLPLKARGNFHAELDRYKAEKAAEKKEAAREVARRHKEQQAQAKEKIAEMSDERAQELMKKLNLTRIQLDKELNSIAHWKPSVILRGI